MCIRASPVNIVCYIVLRKYGSVVIVRNLTDVRKTVETSVEPRLNENNLSSDIYHGPRSYFESGWGGGVTSVSEWGGVRGAENTFSQ